MKLTAEDLHKLITDDLDIVVTSIDMGVSRWSITGTLDYNEFTLPITKEAAFDLVEQEIGQAAFFRDPNKKRKPSKKEDVLGNPVDRKGATSIIDADFLPPTTVKSEDLGKRMSKEMLETLEEFKDSQPMHGRTRRSSQQAQDVSVARSYLLGGETDIVVKWIQHNKSLCS